MGTSYTLLNGNICTMIFLNLTRKEVVVSQLCKCLKVHGWKLFPLHMNFMTATYKNAVWTDVTEMGIYLAVRSSSYCTDFTVGCMEIWHVDGGLKCSVRNLWPHCRWEGIWGHMMCRILFLFNALNINTVCVHHMSDWVGDTGKVWFDCLLSGGMLFYINTIWNFSVKQKNSYASRQICLQTAVTYSEQGRLKQPCFL